ncbi:hypothetical protein MPTK1_4g12320 [Marchantia polymorpha subsp. ruderalis]|uniref:Uncharacterized protein n=2 Tax=Marchantia polymorpha TaxID=3197 RepID=A0AAF6B947_MARPO|nr:hypothetical protein MARPO_0011s0214 [Marchantia polymorpha]BBN08531.1 hypothetical protein Mp_4g12320 [Marchantia polymorpha subsp. ruderalis]|eukprot:PTQ46565.1 hypothetical protein MARPO_0011s0214 [Marchantia polymorpha]
MQLRSAYRIRTEDKELRKSGLRPSGCHGMTSAHYCNARLRQKILARFPKILNPMCACEMRCVCRCEQRCELVLADSHLQALSRAQIGGREKDEMSVQHFRPLLSAGLQSPRECMVQSCTRCSLPESPLSRSPGFLRASVHLIGRRL